MGTRDLTTDGYDPGIDVLSPPADPSGREAYFVLDGGEKLWTDFRGLDTQNREWTLIFTVPSRQEVTIEWDSDTLPEDGYMVPVDSLGRPAGQFIDMKSQSSIHIEAQTGIVARKFFYVLNLETATPVTIQYDIKTGWNLISLPLRTVDLTPDAVLGPLTPIWAYNPEISQYEMPTVLETHKGYWVYTDYDRTFEVTGRIENNLPVQLIPTWNLIGVNQQVLRSTEGVGVVWGFDNQTKRYSPVAPTEYLEPQKGYWFEVGAPVELFGSKRTAKVQPAVQTSIDEPAHIYIIDPSIGDSPLAILELGRDPAAMDGLGPEDYLAPPPVPDAEGAAFFLIDTGSDYARVMRDIRSMSGTQEWLLQIDQSPGVPTVLSWDSSVFTSLETAELVEIDPSTLQPMAGASPISMGSRTTLQLQGPSGLAGTNRFFRISLSSVTAVEDWSIH